MKQIGTIIVNHNGQKYLPDLLGSIFSNPPKMVQQEIVVVDNASSDISVAWIRQNYPAVQLLPQTVNQGFAKGNNIGIERAMERGCDYVFLLNTDTTIEAGCLDRLVAAMEQGEKIGAVQPKILLWPLTDLINSYGNVIHYLGFGYTYGHKTLSDKHQSNAASEVNYCSGAACLLKVDALKKTGLFNEEFFMYHEDLDLGWRLSLMGYQNIIVPSAIVYHKYEFSRSIQKYYYMERNRFLTIFQNYKIGSLLLILPALLMMELGLLLTGAFGGWISKKFKVYAYFLRVATWRGLWQTRRLIQNSRQATDSKVVKNFSGVIEHQELPQRKVDRIANAVFDAYWQIVKSLIVW